MLVLSRKIDEVIEIAGGEITVIVCDIGEGRVRLGITAPPEITIDRAEIARAKRAAAEKKRNCP